MQSRRWSTNRGNHDLFMVGLCRHHHQHLDITSIAMIPHAADATLIVKIIISSNSTISEHSQWVTSMLSPALILKSSSAERATTSRETRRLRRKKTIFLLTHEWQSRVLTAAFHRSCKQQNNFLHTVSYLSYVRPSREPIQKKWFLFHANPLLIAHAHCSWLFVEK